MYNQLFGFLLFACQIIFNESSGISENTNGVASETLSDEHRYADLPEGYVKFPDVHSAYKIHKEHTTWYEARDRCIAEGARLAIADSYEKIVHINSMKNNWRLEWLHVGFYKSENGTNEWIRVDNGFPVTTLPWLRNSPNKGIGRDCAGISLIENGLINYKCYWPDEYFVCEIPI